MYQNLVCSVNAEAPDSVHLAEFPLADMSVIDDKLSGDTHLIMKISSIGRAARSKAGIKVRQPLPHVVVSVAGSKEKETLERLKPQLFEELNIKDLCVDSYDNVLALGEKGYIVGGLEDKKEDEAPVAESGYLVAVPTDIPEELKQEGFAREIVHRLQTMRRAAGFDIADHITTCYRGDEYLEQVIETFADYIQHETLSDSLNKGEPQADTHSESFKLSGKEITLVVKKVE
jgi:isoleucyl-tRNA synthetase